MIWGWWAFDWASQPYFTLGLTFIFGPYFVGLATESFMAEGLDETTADARAQSLWSLGQTITGLFIAAMAPILGAMADHAGKRMPWVILFSIFYVVGAFGLWFLAPGGDFVLGAMICFGIGLIGAEFTTVFTNSLLPELGTREEVSKLSGTGYALGYAGGVLALFIMLLLFVEQENGLTLIGLAPALGLDASQMQGTRAVGPFIALWFIVFMIPFFLWVRETPRATKPGGVRRALAELWQLLKSLPGRKSLFAFLGGSMFYRDSLAALYAFGGTYAKLVLDWSIVNIGVFGIIAAIASAFATWIGGKVETRIGPKRLVILMILVLIGICLFILGLSREAFWGIALAEGSGFPDISFFVCGALLGSAGGILQSSSRSLMCRHADPDKPTEAFGLYALSGKATAFLGYSMISATTFLLGDVRLGMLPLVFLFLLGLVLLRWVDPEGTT